MSLHAQLSPEAQARLEKQRRVSTISSIIISLLVILLIGLILGFIFLPSMLKEDVVIVSYAAPSEDNQDIKQQKVTNAVQRKPSAPSQSMAKVIAANTNSPTSVPVPDIDVPEPSMDFGDSMGFGDGWGSGGDGGGGGGMGGIPGSMQKRCSKEDRMERLLNNGGTAQCEEVVEKGLEWLQKTQNDDGSWDRSNPQAMTGLALLAYLGRCETPLSAKYGDTVLRGITYLIDIGMKQDGFLSTSKGHAPVYEHAIATYALAEAYTFCSQLGVAVPNLGEVTQLAGQYIIDHQSSNGGWAYGYASNGGDLSIAAWQIQALKACKHTKLDFKGISKAYREAEDFVISTQRPAGGFGYKPGSGGHGRGGYHTLTGAGMLSLQMMGKESSKEVRDGADYIIKNSKLDYDTKFADLYGHYYEGQAMINRGGKQWKHYNDMFRDEILNSQNADGSWKKPGDGTKLRAVGAKFETNVHYRTCLSILMLEVYYRFLPGTT